MERERAPPKAVFGWVLLVPMRRCYAQPHLTGVHNTSRSSLSSRVGLIWRLLPYVTAFWFCFKLRSLVRATLIAIVPVVIGEFIAAAVYIACLSSLTWIFWSRLERRSFGDLGLKSSKKFRQFGSGFLVGTLMFTACIVIRLFWGLILFDSLQIDGAVANSLLGRFMYFIGTGVCEEIAFRGYIFQTVGEQRSIWFAVWTTAVLFALVHAPSVGFDLEYYALNILATVLTVMMRLLTGSLWMGIGWHIGINWAVGALFGFTGSVGLILVKSSEALVANQQGEVRLFGSIYLVIMVVNVVAVFLWSRFAGAHVNWGKSIGET